MDRNMMKSKVLVVGGTGYVGRRMVKASLAEGHITFVLQRPETGLDIEKLQMMLSFKQQGARLVEASFSDHQSLVDAVKQVDVVISAMSGVHFRTHNLLLQLKLVDAIKEAGNVKAIQICSGDNIVCIVLFVVWLLWHYSREKWPHYRGCFTPISLWIAPIFLPLKVPTWPHGFSFGPNLYYYASVMVQAYEVGSLAFSEGTFCVVVDPIYFVVHHDLKQH